MELIVLPSGKYINVLKLFMLSPSAAKDGCLIQGDGITHVLDALDGEFLVRLVEEWPRHNRNGSGAQAPLSAIVDIYAEQIKADVLKTAQLKK